MTSIRKSLFLSLAERHLSQIIVLASSIVLARLLTPEEIGIYSLCAAFIAIGTIFRDFGVSEYIIQEKNLTTEKLSGAYALTIITAWTMAALLFSLKGLIAGFYAEQGVADVLTVLSITFIILPFAAPGFALMNRDMAFHNIFVVQVASSATHATTAIYLAYLGFSYMSLAWAALAGIIIQTILITYLRPRESLILPRYQHMKHVWRFGLTFSAARTVEVLMNNSHEFIIAKQFDFSTLGMFSRAYGLINLFWTTITSAVTRVAAPSFASSYHKSERELVNVYKKAISIFTVIACPFYAFSALESYRIILVLFGDQWTAAAPIASILSLSYIIHSILALAPNALIAMGKVKKRLLISVILAPVHIIGIAIFSFYSIQLVASVWIVTWILALILYNYQLSRALGLTYKVIIQNTYKSLLVTAVMISCSISFLYLLKTSDFQDFIVLVLNGAISLAVWTLMVFLVNHPISIEMRNAFCSLLSKTRKN